MLQAPIQADEQQRLALLRACNIIYTLAEQAFDDVARLAADLCDTEIALITLVDSERQWFKARVGVSQTSTARDLSFCGHCITGHTSFVVEDTHLDARFADNPLVTGDPYIRFYAGVPLEVEEGSAVGALSVADRQVRTLTARQLESLRRLAKQVSRELRLRRDLDAASRSTPLPETLIGPGELVGGRWRISRELGRGSIGAVFEAHDREGRRAAIKLLLPEWRSQEHVLERFAREARVLMRLATPHVGQQMVASSDVDPRSDVWSLGVGLYELVAGRLPFAGGTHLAPTGIRRWRRWPPSCARSGPRPEESPRLGRGFSPMGTEPDMGHCQSRERGTMERQGDSGTVMKAFNGVKIFSATVAQSREALGERVMAWLRADPERQVVDTVITQSSDEAFHCIAITIFYWQPQLAATAAG